jgi:predicted Zn finger-like uncharacterized protein
MRFVCESCRAQYMINDEKVGPKGVKVRCRKCGYVIVVKRTEAGAGFPEPASDSSEADDGQATQVMQSPLASPESTMAGEGGGEPEARTQRAEPALEAVEDKAARAALKDSLFGADDDEIGAVFDQVLKSGPGPLSGEAPVASDDDDRQSTRVIEADMVRKLTDESARKPDDGAPGNEQKGEPVPETDWYVAIDEKQTGPLTLERVKEHWDKGEIGPDSLCWRAGYGDWLPVSEVKALAAVLAPQPSRPIVVAPEPAVSSSPSSAPVQSAFAAGGALLAAQPDAQGSASGGDGGEDGGAWKPSAASALASLVSAEMDAMAKPATRAAPPPPDEVPLTQGLLDVPPAEERQVSAARPRAPEQLPAPPPPNPYLANPGATFSAPAVSQYRPPSNRNLIIGIASAGGLVLLVLVGLVVWLATRTPQVVVAPQPPSTAPVAVAQAPTPTAAPPSPAVPSQPPAPQPTPTQPTPVAPAPTAVAEPARDAPPPAEVARRDPSTKGSRQPPTRVARVDQPEPPAPPPPPPAREARPSAPESGGGDDDFAKAFGVAKEAPAKKEASGEGGGGKKAPVYIPPAPGSAPLKESLGQSDIFEVVLANKADLAKCAELQRQKDPSTSGRLMMRWTIETSGKTSNIGVASEEFKGTYMATCVSGLVKGWQFPRHSQKGEPVVFPFKF